jgi:hypothetical protein
MKNNYESSCFGQNLTELAKISMSRSLYFSFFFFTFLIKKMGILKFLVRLNERKYYWMGDIVKN